MIAAVHWDHGHLKGVPFGFTIGFIVVWVLIGIFVITRFRPAGTEVNVHRIVALLPLVVGVIVIIQNRKFGDASERSARQTFGREPGRNAHLAGRAIAAFVGVIMVVAGAQVA